MRPTKLNLNKQHEYTNMMMNEDGKCAKIKNIERKNRFQTKDVGSKVNDYDRCQSDGRMCKMEYSCQLLSITLERTL